MKARHKTRLLTQKEHNLLKVRDSFTTKSAQDNRKTMQGDEYINHLAQNGF